MPVGVKNIGGVAQGYFPLSPHFEIMFTWLEPGTFISQSGHFTNSQKRKIYPMDDAFWKININFLRRTFLGPVFPLNLFNFIASHQTERRGDMRSAFTFVRYFSPCAFYGAATPPTRKRVESAWVTILAMRITSVSSSKVQDYNESPVSRAQDGAVREIAYDTGFAYFMFFRIIGIGA